jgi:oxygen-independent coproporphyrinogen-3 oxidase
VPQSSDSFFLLDRYIDALAKEWKFYEDNGILEGVSVDTIYIGGGTPSMLCADMWSKLDDALFSRIDKTMIREWSVECNPDSFTIEKARMYADSGVTRLTFGVQSLNPKELSICGRAHSTDQAMRALSDSRLFELFNSIAVDIIYALPGQTVNSLDNTLSCILSISHISHLSAYELTIAEGTPFGRHEKNLKLPDDDTVTEMYELIGKRCAERGIDQYEISNYARPGFESIHNKAYWSHKPYIGLGASAHSYIHPNRWSNIADIERYVSLISANKAARDFEEILDPLELSREMIFLGLRNIDGIDENKYIDSTGLIFCTDNRQKYLQKFIDSGLLKKTLSKWIPTSKGMLFADMMARELAE